MGFNYGHRSRQTCRGHDRPTSGPMILQAQTTIQTHPGKWQVFRPSHVEPLGYPPCRDRNPVSPSRSTEHEESVAMDTIAVHSSCRHVFLNGSSRWSASREWGASHQSGSTRWVPSQSHRILPVQPGAPRIPRYRVRSCTRSKGGPVPIQLPKASFELIDSCLNP